jgi:hypothetical protein
MTRSRMLRRQPTFAAGSALGPAIPAPGGSAASKFLPARGWTGTGTLGRSFTTILKVIPALSAPMPRPSSASPSRLVRSRSSSGTKRPPVIRGDDCSISRPHAGGTVALQDDAPHPSETLPEDHAGRNPLVRVHQLSLRPGNHQLQSGCGAPGHRDLRDMGPDV